MAIAMRVRIRLSGWPPPLGARGLVRLLGAGALVALAAAAVWEARTSTVQA